MGNSGERALRLVLGNQLFPIDDAGLEQDTPVFMAEDMGLCTDYRHHQQKIVLFLAAMRCYRDALVEDGLQVHYLELDAHDARNYEEKLLPVVEETGAKVLEYFEIEDKPMEARIAAFAEARGLETRVLESPMFLTSRDEFEDYRAGRDRLRMAEFYKGQRRRLGVLVDDEGEPEGGRWSFDELNRKKLPRGMETPERPTATRGANVDDVIELVAREFADHPGDAGQFAWPVTREDALAWLDAFLEARLERFGPYEDAISSSSDTVFHSLLSPAMNLGLLTPAEIVRAVREFSAGRDVPMESLEGFYRQVIGWREFVRGVYQALGERQEAANFWEHERELTDAWYRGDTGIPILDDTVRLALDHGWTHHIPRLMVLANLMTLCEIRPAAAHRWFMEMFVDSSEWVMGPNVFGMGLFSDGGLIVTKPYICGSNYLRKMSDYPRGDWCDVVDGLYWRFIGKHRDFFSSNPRLALMVGTLDRMDKDRLDRILDEAESFIGRVTKLSSD